jgi:YegS/Rv2252/BmrU family lipid kinase
MPRLKLILNPAADRGHAAELEPSLRGVVDEEVQNASHNGHSYELEWCRTEGPWHAAELAREAASGDFDAVVAIGGDGTVHEVVNGLMHIDADRRPQLGVIPIGSGNDFAHNMGLPDEPHAAARCVIGDTARVVDVGRISDAAGRQQFWDNTVGIGFSGAVNIASRRHTQLRGFMMYLVSVLETILFRPPALEARLTVDGTVLERSVSMISICNGPREGGGFPVNPNAIMDDGLITYTLMRKMGRVNMLRFLPVVMNANHLKYPRFFQEGVAHQIGIETDTGMAIHVDGELFSSFEADTRRVEVEIIPQALRVLCSC